MTGKFKTGDRLICIESSPFNAVEYGQLYTVERESNGFVILKERIRDDQKWLSSRFKKANAHILKKRLGVLDENG